MLRDQPPCKHLQVCCLRHLCACACVQPQARIGHFVEAQILEALNVDYIDESEVSWILLQVRSPCNVGGYWLQTFQGEASLLAAWLVLHQHPAMLHQVRRRRMLMPGAS